MKQNEIPTPINVYSEDEASIQEVFEQFFGTLSRQTDERTLIVTAHLFIEYWLDWVLKKCLPHPQKLFESANFTFFEKLVIAESLGILNDMLSNATRRLNHMRNEVAHKLKYRILESDINLLKECLVPAPKEYEPDIKKLGTPKYELLHFCFVFCGFVTGYVISKKEPKSKK